MENIILLISDDAMRCSRWDLRSQKAPRMVRMNLGLSPTGDDASSAIEGAASDWVEA